MLKNDNQLESLSKELTSGITLSGVLAGLLFSTLVFFISLSKKDMIVIGISTFIAFTSFLFIESAVMYYETLAALTVIPSNDNKNINDILEMYNFGNSLAVFGYRAFIISISLFMLYINIYAGIILSILMVTLYIYFLKKIPQ